MNLQPLQILIGVALAVLFMFVLERGRSDLKHAPANSSEDNSSFRQEVRQWTSRHNDVHTRLHESHGQHGDEIQGINQRVIKLEEHISGEGDADKSASAITADRRTLRPKANRWVILRDCAAETAEASTTVTDASPHANARNGPDPSRTPATNVWFPCKLPESVERYMETSTATLGQIDSKQDRIIGQQVDAAKQLTTINAKQDQILEKVQGVDQRVETLSREQRQLGQRVDAIECAKKSP